MVSSNIFRTETNTAVLWLMDWSPTVHVVAFNPYSTKWNCSVAIKRVGILSPRGEDSAWNVLKWGKILP
jgi:hypothetical protein